VRRSVDGWPNGAIDLIEGLLDIGRDHEDVAGVAQVELLVPAGA
jgi:hypothetical protein